MAKITYANIYTQGLKDEEAATAFARGLAQLREAEPIHCSHSIKGEVSNDGERFEHRDPCDHARVVSTAHSAGPHVIKAAVDAARVGFEAWRDHPWQERVESIQRVSDRLRDHYDYLIGLLGLECGKTRADAVAEVEECIVIIDLFCQQVKEANGFHVEQIAPSYNSKAFVQLEPFGVFGVIGPFNFPLAIPMGMAAAALIAGNSVVMKPSAMAPASGNALAAIFESIGLPKGAFNVIHGGGETGAALAESDLDGLVFTGSAEVGLNLAQLFIQPPFTRPVISEMGGKNPVIVTGAVPDLEAAAKATVRSAFGMSGQKCNACSRAIVTADIYDDWVKALEAATAEIQVGDPLNPEVFTGPVISEQSVKRFEAAVESARSDGRIITGGKKIEGPGHFLQPTVVDGLPTGHELTREEKFLPFLTVTKVADLDAALDEANAVRYGLSAGIFSGDEEEKSRFLRDIEAGIVFVNNPGGATTGVWPGSQTMAGWKASGTSGKGGFGPWYLHQFARERSCTIFD